jgi:hypothetical protein
MDKYVKLFRTQPVENPTFEESKLGVVGQLA